MSLSTHYWHLWSYLDDIAIRVQCRVTVELNDHGLDQGGELSWGSPVSGSLIRELRGTRVSRHTSQRSFGRLTSSKRPSIFNCHAGMPWPVSKFGGSAVPGVDVSLDCHACPETV